MDNTFPNATQNTSAPFRHDIVGSFLRPEAIKQARARFLAGEITAEQLRQVEDEEITKLVQKQKEVGLKDVTDGEFRRSWWHLDFFWGFDGIQKKVLEEGYIFNGEKTRAEAAILTGKISFSQHPHIEHFKFLKSVAGDDVVAKQNIPSPANFLYELIRPENRAITDSVYFSLDELTADIAKAYRDAILAFYEAGCRYLQIDDSTLGIMCDPKIREASEKQGNPVAEFLRMDAEMNNKATENLPKDLVITMHICRGNFRSDWLGQGGYEPVVETIAKCSNITGLFLEFDTERAGGFEILKSLQHKQVVLGLFTSKFGQLEDKNQILARIKEASKFVDINQICVSTQCGFASTEEGNILTEEEQWNKLRFIKEVADGVWQ